MSCELQHMVHVRFEGQIESQIKEPRALTIPLELDSINIYS